MLFRRVPQADQDRLVSIVTDARMRVEAAEIERSAAVRYAHQFGVPTRELAEAAGVPQATLERILEPEIRESDSA